MKVVTTSGHGINLAPVGTSKHGLIATGGNGGTSDGISAVAGTGGVPIRGDITGNITGNLSGSVGSVTGAVGSVTGAVGSVTGNVGGNVVGSVASVTAAVSIAAGQLFVKKNTALANFMFVMLDSTTHQPAAGLTVSGTVSIDGGSFGSLTNATSGVANGWYKVNLAAADVNGTVIALRFTATGADDRDVTIITQA